MDYRQLGSSGQRVPAHTPYRQQEGFARLNPAMV
ncbi:hypothetical protein SAMN06295955_10342 [Sphingopyxis indica]|uniref:Uncharacterized protein n=1 Tax=Sphingopyxis indica TaxID=436663 RepID=A0A239G5P5_9SPHN|nr:hypothetical protein SAMN06295955_10342 [Sphingopyxis indica]